jgi:oxalate decarboxylase
LICYRTASEDVLAVSLHWHPNASEWQYYLSGKARMTVFSSDGAHTMDFNANDVGFVPRVAGHYIENTGNADLVFLEMSKASEYMKLFPE